MYKMFSLTISVLLGISLKMENIEVLDNCTKPFQLIGLQCFSLKSLGNKKKPKYPSAYATIYLLIVLIILSSTLGFFIRVTSNDDENARAENNLNAIVKYLTKVLLVVTIYSSFILSYFHNFRLMEFFRISQKICSISFYEFNFKISFTKLSKNLVRFWTIFTVLFLILMAFVVSVYHFIQKPMHGIIMSLIPITIFHMIIIRFGFYVCIVNYHLEVLSGLIARNFRNGLSKKNQNLFSINDPKRKLLALRKIYMLIEEMTSHVNDTLGISLMLMLVLITTAAIRLGYRMFMVIICSLPFHSIGGKGAFEKYLKILKFLSSWNFFLIFQK